jgi:hypothetical protein
MSFNRFAYLLSHLRLDDKTQREELRPHDKFAPARYRTFWVGLRGSSKKGKDSGNNVQKKLKLNNVSLD